MQTPGEQQPSAGGQDGGTGGTGDVGRVLAGRYRVTGRLGRGGMGVVWRAVDQVLGREVALKELRTFTDAGGAELEELRTRMQREARAAARVRHPGVIAVHDVAEHDGRPVIVMELIEGPSLDDLVRERGSLDPREAAAVGAKVMDALAAAHQVGVLHRDVKPGNVLLEHGGERVVLTDFGIASMEDPDDGASTHLTGSGELVGSLDYLAPERARGEQPRPASDVWALGATLYAAVEGAAPFRRTSTWSTLNAIVVDPLPEPKRAGTLAPVLAELLDKDPEKRVDAVRAAALLRAVADGTAPPEGSDTVRLGKADGPAAPVPSSDATATPRKPVTSAAPHEPTIRSAVHPGVPAGPGHSGQQGQPPGGQAPFGAPQVLPGAFGPYGGSGPHGGPDSDGQTGGTRGARTPGRTRALIAAAVAAVLLTGTGVTYAVMAQGGEEGTRAANDSGGSASSGAKGHNAGKASGRSGGSEPSPSGRDSEGKPGVVAGGSSGGKDGDGGQGGDGAADSGSGSDGGGSADGGDGGGSSAGAGSSGAGEPEPAPVCDPRGGGKYDCTVWKTATSYDAGHKAVGQLNAGTNYFYCQAKLSHRETSGRWTNVWWAKTDDDSGNKDVFVSVVYVKGGNNDEPVPGLPTC